eukprot:scaffold10056_cov164-Amphora_coffeaeformis.AAC.2
MDMIRPDQFRSSERSLRESLPHNCSRPTFLLLWNRKQSPAAHRQFLGLVGTAGWETKHYGSYCLKTPGRARGAVWGVSLTRLENGP